MKRKNIALLLSASLCLCASASVTETFTTANQSPWDGTADLTWVGDVAAMQVSGNRLLQISTTDTAAHVILTDTGISGHATERAWSGLLGSAGGAMAVNINHWGGLILASDSTVTADIIAGTMNGFRLIWRADDALALEQASGNGWVEIKAIANPSGPNWSGGTTFTATLTSAGIFSFADNQGQSGTYNAGGPVTLESYAGYIFQAAKTTKSFEMDNFSVSAVFSDEPVAANDTYTLEKDTVLTNAAPGLLANDSDGNGDPLTAVKISDPANGTLLSFSTNGSFIYQPDPGFIGTDTFTYTAYDGTYNSNTGTVTLVVGRDLSVDNIFNSSMVLQRGRRVPVWGRANPGDVIQVSFAGQNVSAIADAAGNWTAWLKPMPASTAAADLTVSGPHQTNIFSNVLVGDIWVCSGQSNMARPMDVTNPEILNKNAEIAAANYPEIRLMSVPPTYSSVRVAELPDPAAWTACSPASAAGFSATAYFFGRKVHLDTGVPLGLIESAVGGTPVERWMPEDLRVEIGYTYSDRITELYNAMIHPLTRFPIKGAIWYQGESNGYDTNDQLALYKDKLEALILGWRDQWGIGEFPFYFVQICPHIRTDELKLPILWDAFTRTLSVPNTGMAILNDLSQPGDITEVHPANKQDVGLRLGLAALETTYGIDTNSAWSSPLFDSAVAEGSSVRVYFDPETLGSGLASRDGNPLTLFELAGVDEVYYPNATATIDGNTVLVSHPSVPSPAFIRFGWNGNVPHNFMNAAGLPVDTFSKPVTTQSPPVARPDQFNIIFNSTAQLDVLANDTDREGDVLSITVADTTVNGALSLSNNVLTYAPDTGFTGTDRFSYQLSDGTDTSGEVLVSIVVTTNTPYQAWIESYGLSGTAALADHDVESDGFYNLQEYALGGNPITPDAAEIMPVFFSGHEAGSNWFYYLHDQRIDDPALNGTVQLNTNLTSSLSWDTAGIQVSGLSGHAFGFRTVTNRTDIGGQEFLRLRVELN